MITLPIHDYPTRSASGFLIRYILPRSEPLQLLGPLDRKQLFKIQAFGDCIIGVGHGSPDSYAGHNNQVMMTIDDVPDVKGKVIVLLSCETAQQLGPRLVDAGAVSYIGWKENFVWLMDSDKLSTPWSDDWASPEIMPVIDCMNLILDGEKTGDAFDAMLAGFDKMAEDEDEDLIKSCLLFNKKNAVFLGDRNARVQPRPKIRLPLPPPPIILPISAQ